MHSVSATQQGYFPSLDGLRFLACLLVIIGHAFLGYWPLSLALATEGVRIFFALSGFLITTLLLRERAAHGRISLGRFYLRRVLRIFPLYYLALALALFLMWQIVPKGYGNWMVSRLDTQLLRKLAITNALFVGNWLHKPLPVAIGTLWTVHVEEQFYLLFPATFAWSCARMPTLRPILIGLLISWGVRLYRILYSRGTLADDTLANADYLLLGALLAQLLHTHGEALARHIRRLGTAGELGALIALLLFAWGMHFSAQLGIVYWMGTTSLNALVTALLVALLVVRAGRVSQLLARPRLRWLGELTYGAYLFHAFAISVPRPFLLPSKHGNGDGVPIWINFLLCLPLTFAMAYLLRRYVEGPILALKHRFAR